MGIDLYLREQAYHFVKSPTKYLTMLINRRDFLHTSAMGAVALTLPEMPAFFKEIPMGIVVHSYGMRWYSIV